MIYVFLTYLGLSLICTIITGIMCLTAPQMPDEYDRPILKK